MEDFLDLKPFDKVLVAYATSNDRNNYYWKVDFYSHNKGSMHICVGTISHRCIPYDGNEHLVGKKVENIKR